jgi:hypothetical protein
VRLICEELDGTFFIEVILNESDCNNFECHNELLGEFVGDVQGFRNFNLFIRKEQTCHSSKERLPVAEKDFQRTYEEKLMKESPKRKPSLLHTAKLAVERKRRQRNDQKEA